MFDLKSAIGVVNLNMPMGTIKAYSELPTKFVFLVIDDDPLEGDFDPYYYVDKITGELYDFSLFTDEIIQVMLPIPKTLV